MAKLRDKKFSDRKQTLPILEHPKIKADIDYITFTVPTESERGKK